MYPKVIGIDFDNTIVSYDSIFYTVAAEQGLIADKHNPGKKAIRDAIRALPHGEEQWQQLQSLVYGSRIGGAMLINGVQDFLLCCHHHDCQVYIISHKTEFANYGNPKPNLRKAALEWMQQNNFFTPSGLGLSEKQVFFGATRKEKIEHIQRLGCTHFIDDLEEVFLEPSFPDNTERILYLPQAGDSPEISQPAVHVFSTWQQITHHCFKLDS